jgi:hypothetical protein
LRGFRQGYEEVTVGFREDTTMSTRTMLAAGLLVLALLAPSLAQQPGSAVQLPTVSFFGGSTTVSVPDGGSALFGGVNRASSGRTQFGVPLAPFAPFRNSAIGSNRGASNLRVTATIHDFEAMDAYLLGQGAVGGTAPPVGAAAMGKMLLPRGGAAGRSWQLAAPAAAVPAASVVQVQAQRAVAERSKADEAADFFARGQQAEADGKPNVAKIYYQMVARRDAGALAQLAADRLSALDSGAAQVAQSPSP